METPARERVRDLLRRRDFSSLIALCEKDRRFWQEVRFRLYDIDDHIRWPAIEAAAEFMRSRWGSGEQDKVRQYIRTLFWSMTDESGGIGWSSPQTIAEIIFRIPELIDPYGSMMIAYSIDEPPLAKGCMWGIGRVGGPITEAVESFRDKVLRVFDSDDSETLGLASWAVGAVDFAPSLTVLKKLVARIEPVRIYIDGEFREKSLGGWAQESIREIEEAA